MINQPPRWNDHHGRAHPENVLPFGAAHGRDHATAIPGSRYAGWGRVAAVALFAAGAVWAIGFETGKRIEVRDFEPAYPGQHPPPGYPKATRTADNNNMLMRLGLVANLDGTAVAYSIEADRLVSDGQFRTDLRLAQLAALLKVSPDSIANPRSPNEIDPDAELFRAQAGTLTQRSKDVSRNRREQQLREGKIPDAVVPEWVVTNYSFTLNRLKHPSDEEMTVLSAITRAASEIRPLPGDRIRAVGVIRSDLALGRIALAGGLLPVEVPQGGSEEPLARP
jgi:hypothetical protein